MPGVSGIQAHDAHTVRRKRSAENRENRWQHLEPQAKRQNLRESSLERERMTVLKHV